jgi:hypothetical protein
MYNSLADCLALKHKKMDLNLWIKEYIDRKTIFWFFSLQRHHWNYEWNKCYPNVITGCVCSCIIDDYTLKKPNIDWKRYGSWMPNTHNSYCKLIRLDLPTCTTYRTLDCLFSERIDAINALNYFWDKRFDGYKLER